jgi:3-oxoacyl-[acyl-carrier protein] reductase
MDINATSAFMVARAAPKLFPKEGGSVALVSSVAARTGLANHEAIASAKAALIGLALSAAATYAAKRIRFNVVAPGLTRTPLTEKITANEAAMKASVQMHPLGRIGEPEEIASAIEWFLDPGQSWVTGQVLGVDGGLGAVRARIST